MRPRLAPTMSLQPRRVARLSLLQCGLVLILGIVSPTSARAWGPTGHRLVNNWAIESLPAEIREFFESNRGYVVDHANDPDEWMLKDRYERKQHYIYLDKYGLFPFLTLPHSFQRAVEQYGSGRVNRDGLLPWHIGDYSLRLTNALKARNWEEAKLDAAVLAHYVADAHDPLHTTQNYDGQLTQEPGLADRYEIRLPDRYSRFFIMHPEEAAKIGDPTEYAFGMCIEAHVWVESIILADRRSRDGLVDYTDEYFDRFYSQVGHNLVREINDAARDAASYWYTAWLNAGSPTLPSR